jgi:hypothetical protein
LRLGCWNSEICDNFSLITPISGAIVGQKAVADMKKHGKSSALSVEKKDVFFYHSLNRSFCRLARKISSRSRKKSTEKNQGG